MGTTCFVFRCLSHRVCSSSGSDNAGEEEVGRSRSDSLIGYSFRTLESAAQGFQPSYKIGEGGFGSVYKGRLANGAVVAIKVLSARSVQGEREFSAEIESMTSAKHENLLRLRGYCASGSNRMLVYDYMQRNSLAQTLLSGKHCDINFTWAVRRKISLGIARGLAFLHEEVKPRIIHRDIKPSNILLDSDLTPKISDFGLAKLFPDNVTHISTRVAGTIGYLAPEYARCGKLTRKSDVYSFGVLLLEIISGRSGRNYVTEAGECSIVEKAWQLYTDEQVLEFVDPALAKGVPEEEAVQSIKVALLCVQETPSLRPSMSRVAKMLSGQIDITTVQVSQPGLINNFGSMRIAPRPTFKSFPARHFSSESKARHFSSESKASTQSSKSSSDSYTSHQSSKSSSDSYTSHRAICNSTHITE